ncbi:acyl-[acyl-carrier-protein] thioesterase [Bacteroidota bacterium]
MKYTDSDLIFRLENRIPSYYVSLNGQPQFYTLASMLLEGAAIHATSLGFGYHDMMRDKVYWVLSRFHIIMHSYPMMDEPVIVETWPKRASKLFFMRDYHMYSGNNRLLASASTAWLILDGNTGRPKKIDAGSSLKDFPVKDLHAIDIMPDKLPGIPEPDRRRSVVALYSDLDINQHVNAIKYIEWIQDCYDEDTYKSENVKEFQINYQLETRYGEEVDIRIKNKSPEDAFDYFEGIRTLDENSAFRARMKFEKLN